jgi:Rrf2 family protein
MIVTLCVTKGTTMSASNRLSTAVKALCYLAKVFPETKSSSEIAEAIGVNASKLRQILSQLMKSEIVGSAKGANGGFYVAQDFTSLSLYEIYAALEDRKVLDLDVADAKNARERDTRAYNDYFDRLFGDMQRQIEKTLQTITLGEIRTKNESGKK